MVNPHDIAQVQAETGMAPVQAYYHLQGRAALRNLHAQQVRAAARLAVDAYGARMADLQQAVAGPAVEQTIASALRAADQFRAERDELARQVENLKRSNVALRIAAEADRAKAALIDHVISAEDSSLVLCHANYNDRTRRWSFAPLCSLEEAQRLMDADLASAEEAECACCAGTGEGRNEGASCAACGGRG